MKSNNNISGVLLAIGAIAVVLFILKAADGSLDFYGSIGFDMFDERSPFDDGKDNYKHKHHNDNDNDRKLTVKFNTDDSYRIKIKAGDESKTITTNEKGSTKTTLYVDDDIKKVCISSGSFDKCQKINDDIRTVTFNLR